MQKLTRCAVYTRKSTEHNLDLAFTSLDAQREACEAYIRSQAGEGWRIMPGRHDDGGLSGASLDRPALQALLAEVRARRIDVLVVYTPTPEMLRLAALILDSKLQAFDPSGFRDRYEEALVAHLTARQAGMPPQPKQSWAVPRRAVNLMEALRRSIAADENEATRPPVPARKRA